MKFLPSLSAALCALFALVSHAKDVPAQPALPTLADPSDPAAVTAAPAYHSAFQHYIVMPEQKNAPDKVWRAANDEVARLQGHAGHIRDAASQAVPADKHHGHGMSHGGKE